jgi:hypothetical protein
MNERSRMKRYIGWFAAGVVSALAAAAVGAVLTATVRRSRHPDDYLVETEPAEAAEKVPQEVT